jgi:ABC-type nickel/cobalt efflux system permease component RcnA
MDATVLGLLLAVCISIGMATTISLVVITIVMGKAGILVAVSNNYAITVEKIIGILSGGAISIFGALFLLTAINSALY